MPFGSDRPHIQRDLAVADQEHDLSTSSLGLRFMSLFKRNKSPIWWIDFIAPDGKRIRRSAKTAVRKEAAELHDKLKSEIWRVQRLGERPKHVWAEAAGRWLREQVHK